MLKYGGFRFPNLKGLAVQTFYRRWTEEKFVFAAQIAAFVMMAVGALAVMAFLIADSSNDMSPLLQTELWPCWGLVFLGSATFAGLALRKGPDLQGFKLFFSTVSLLLAVAGMVLNAS
jgi:hypothetical protein